MSDEVSLTSSAAMTVCADAIGLLFAFVMLRAGLHKLAAPRQGARRIDAWELLPAGAGRVLAPLLGGAEVAAGLLSALPAQHARAAPLLMCLLALYAGAIGLGLARGRRGIDCGCGGAGVVTPLSGWLLLRTLVLMLLAWLLQVAPPARALSPGGWIGVLALAAFAILVYLALELLLARDTLLTDD